MTIYVYDFDNPTKDLFKYESDIIPRIEEEIFFDDIRYIVTVVSHRVLKEKCVGTNGKWIYSGRNSSRYVYLYVKKFELYDSNK